MFPFSIELGTKLIWGLGFRRGKIRDVKDNPTWHTHSLEDEALPPCYPFVLWWRSVKSGKILLLETGTDILNMLVENKNCVYIHMYVTRTRNPFWEQQSCVNELVNEPINVVTNEVVNVTKSVNECVDVPIADHVTKSVSECVAKPIGEVNRNGEVHVGTTFYPDKVYVSDEDTTYNVFNGLSSSSNSEYHPFSHDGEE
ncbi:hypothetical protein E2542_SST04770 [Spatholobus suberectus]|nr:hypothetical protein E2542_SST04770 [Spatholobus suberectus]